jgi:hypothetical protein
MLAFLGLIMRVPAVHTMSCPWRTHWPGIAMQWADKLKSCTVCYVPFCMCLQQPGSVDWLIVGISTTFKLSKLGNCISNLVFEVVIRSIMACTSAV